MATRSWSVCFATLVILLSACSGSASDAGSADPGPASTQSLQQSSADGEEADASTSGGSTTTPEPQNTTTTEPPGLYVAASDSEGGTLSDFASIADAIEWADPGDEIILRSGTHLISGEVAFGKQLTLRAEVPGEAIITSSLEPPRSQRNDTLPLGYLAIRDEAADGSRILDIRFENIGHSFTGQAIYVERVRDVLIKGNSFRHTGARAIIVFDTEDVRVTENQFLNPYLPDDEPNVISARLAGRTTRESYMDYGVMVYGSIRPVVDHNYFFGIFHQALSFKESSVDASAVGNTFEGFAFTALFVGQNRPGGNSFDRFGPPRGAPEAGTITVTHNVFRPVADDFGEYLPAIALRLSYFDADVLLDANVVEGAFVPLQVDCNDGGAPNCAGGFLTITNNVLSGSVIDLDGVSHRFDRSSCLHLRDVAGASLGLEVDSNTIVGCGLPYELGGLDFSFTNNVVADAVGAPIGTPQTVSGNVVWNAPGSFGDDVVEMDPSFAESVTALLQPSVSLFGATTEIIAFSASPDSPDAFRSGAAGANR